MITVAYGKDMTGNTLEVLQKSDIHSYLKPGMSVSIKPNLVVAHPATDGATTHPEIVEGIILFLKESGIKRIRIIESSWVGGRTKDAFTVCGYDELSRKYSIPLIDLKSDTHTTLEHQGMKIGICDEALQTDFLINVPVLKAHCQTRMTCCMKNLKGCIPDSEKRRYHTLGINKPVAVLNALLKTGYCVVDGICGDLSFEEGGNPVESNRIIAGQNPFVVDSYCAELIGYHPDEIGYLSYGKKMGLGTYDPQNINIVELYAQNKPVHQSGRGRAAERYQRIINEDAACSACYSSLVYALHRMGKTQSSKKIHIGQGFKGRSGEGIGIGNCARGFTTCVPGCPPKATDIINILHDRG